MFRTPLHRLPPREVASAVVSGANDRVKAGVDGRLVDVIEGQATDPTRKSTNKPVSCNLARMSSKRQVTIFRNRLARLRERRRQAKTSSRASRRALTSKQRDLVLKKTDGRCHICGGKVGPKWQADHVSSHAHGGAHAEDNYLAAHTSLRESLSRESDLGPWLRRYAEIASLDVG